MTSAYPGVGFCDRDAEKRNETCFAQERRLLYALFGCDHYRAELIFWGVLYWILQEKHHYELRAKASAENIAKTACQSLSDELDKVDLIVLFARDEIQHQLASRRFA